MLAKVKLKLRTKFTLLLLVLLIVGITLGGIGLWQTIQGTAQTEFRTRGLMLIAAMNSVRGYTSQDVGPLLATGQFTQGLFIRETIPAFSARQVFQRFTQNTANADVIYKEATLNPTNPLDQSDDFESAIVQQMRGDSNLKEVSGFRTLSTGRAYYVARPIVVSAQSCLGCHSTPDAAPKGLTDIYTSGGGFGWNLNEIIGTQIIYVPAEEVLDQDLRTFLLVGTIFIVTLVVGILLINFTLNRMVIQPVTVMGSLAHKISIDQLEPGDLESAKLVKITTNGDELGALAQVFRKMAQEVRDRTQRLQEKVQQLHIEIDEIKRKKQVEEIVDSTFFGNIQAKARVLREQRQRAEGDAPKDDSEKNVPPQDDSATA
jgi:methyl-accepting chemotaxis protein